MEVLHFTPARWLLATDYIWLNRLISLTLYLEIPVELVHML